jgi:hypothetical protein
MQAKFRNSTNNARFLSDSEVESCRVDREFELNDIINHTVILNDNILILGERGAGKTFLTRIFELYLKKNRSDIFTIRIDLTSIHFYSIDSKPSFSKVLPILILEQLCRDIWVNLLNNEYSNLLLLNDYPEKFKLFKKKTEIKLIEIHNLLKREQQKFVREKRAMLGGSLGIKGEINDGEKIEWQNRTLHNFEILELIKEVKTTILKEYSINKIILICDEANLLTETEQYSILQDYLDFFGSNQFSFVMVAGNDTKTKLIAERTNLSKIIELKGFTNKLLVQELIYKTFHLENIIIDEKIYELLFTSFSGNIRFILATFDNGLTDMMLNNKNKLELKNMEKIILDTKLRIEMWNSEIPK